MLMGLLLWSIVTKQQPREPEVSFSRFVQAVEEAAVAEVTIQGQHIRGRYKVARDARRALQDLRSGRSRADHAAARERA